MRLGLRWARRGSASARVPCSFGLSTVKAHDGGRSPTAFYLRRPPAGAGLCSACVCQLLKLRGARLQRSRAERRTPSISETRRLARLSQWLDVDAIPGSIMEAFTKIADSNPYRAY